MKHLKKKLNLNKQTVAVLQSDQLVKIQGGTGREDEITDLCNYTTPRGGCTYNPPCYT